MSTSLHNRSLFIAQCVLCIASLIYSPRIYIMYKKLRLYYVRDLRLQSPSSFSSSSSSPLVPLNYRATRVPYNAHDGQPLLYYVSL